MQVEDQKVLELGLTVLVQHLDLLPHFHLVDERVLPVVLHLVVLHAAHPALIVKDRLDVVFLHVANDQIKCLHLSWERSQADRVEIYNLISHVLEHSIEREVVVLAQAELKECHVFLILLVLIAQLIVEKAAEKLCVALLRVDGEGLPVTSALLVIVKDGLSVRPEHAQEDEKRADHHTCTTLASLAMNNDHRLSWQVL